MAPEVKQRYQQMAEEGRQKYDQDMAAYRQGNFSGDASTDGATPGTVVTTTAAAPSTSTVPAPVAAAPAVAGAPTTTVVVTSQNLVTVPATATTTAAGTTYITSGDYSSLLQ